MGGVPPGTRVCGDWTCGGGRGPRGGLRPLCSSRTLTAILAQGLWRKKERGRTGGQEAQRGGCCTSDERLERLMRGWSVPGAPLAVELDHGRH